MTKKLIVISFIIGFLLGGYAAFIEPFNVKVVERKIVTEKWQGQNPINIALVADVHAIAPWMTSKRVKKIIEQINTLEPDLVLLLGDYVATHPFGIQIDPDEGVAPYKNLSARCGVYAVLGNHEFHGSEGWPEALKRTGLPVLENDAVNVSCGDHEFWMAGLEDLWWQKADVVKTLSQVTDSKPVIMMMHNPDSFVDVPEHVVLSVAGHTHGGQIRLPFIGAVSFVVPSKYGKRFAYGHIQENGKDMIVSGGLGTTGLPLRFLNPPEIVMVTVQSK